MSAFAGFVPYSQALGPHGRGYAATRATCGPPHILSPALNRWGPRRRQGLCSHHGHLWAATESPPPCSEALGSPRQHRLCSHQGRPGLIACPVSPSNGKNTFFAPPPPFFLRFCPFFGFFCVFFLVFFMSLEPICIAAHHHMWHFSSSLASLSHICCADISNLDRSIRSPPRCGVAIVQVHRVLVVGKDQGHLWPLLIPPPPL